MADKYANDECRIMMIGAIFVIEISRSAKREISPLFSKKQVVFHKIREFTEINSCYSAKFRVFFCYA